MKMLVGQRFLLRKEVSTAHDTCITLTKASAYLTSFSFPLEKKLCQKTDTRDSNKGDAERGEPHGRLALLG